MIRTIIVPQYKVYTIMECSDQLHSQFVESNHIVGQFLANTLHTKLKTNNWCGMYKHLGTHISRA